MSEHSQGEIPFKVQEAIKKLGYAPKEADIVKIKESLKGTETPAPVVELSKEQKLENRIKELADGKTRRDLEEMLRTLGVEPTKQDYPDKLSLAKAIAEKEATA